MFSKQTAEDLKLRAQATSASFCDSVTCTSHGTSTDMRNCGSNTACRSVRSRAHHLEKATWRRGGGCKPIDAAAATWLVSDCGPVRYQLSTLSTDMAAAADGLAAFLLLYYSQRATRAILCP